MKNFSIRQVIQYFFIVLCMIACTQFLACGKNKDNTVLSADDLPGKKIGVQLGTTGDIYVSDYEEDGSGTVVERYNKGSDAILALKQGKIDAVVIDVQPAKAFVNSNSDLTILDDPFVEEDYAICISKNKSTLKASINEALAALRADGTLQSIIDNYIGDNAGNSPYTSPSGISRTNGTLVMATNAYFPPYEYYENGSITGIDADMALAIADYLGMNLTIEDMEFDSIITAVQSGKADMGVSGMTVTEERLKNIDFTDSYTTSQQVIVVRSSETGSSLSFSEKFKNDFLTDARYQYILNGLKNTIIIALCAAIIGIIIGFLVAVVRSNHDKTGSMKAANFICNVYLTIIRGTPAMVQLLIIYYIIFGSVNINKLIVAILAFGINSGAYVAEIFRSGIMAIDNGQFEAARSLGLTYRQTMIHVILPQAFKNVLPALANEFIVLLKETSISGYIGLTDLTRGGDIIRSITYDAFLPLIGVAIIYLVIVMILSSLVKKLERRLRSNERS
jgi:polar amino acid transport system substrate-binding protein